MDLIFDGVRKACLLIYTLDAELMGIVLLSLKVSLSALLIGSALGVPVGALISLKKRFPLRHLTLNILNTAMGLPPVVVGLFLYLMLSRRGPLGFMGLLYTAPAMIIAQSVLAFPIVASLSYAAINGVPPIIRQAALSLGAAPFQAAMAIVKEARYGIISGVMAAFGRLSAEVGAVLIVGGNIAGRTRVITSAIVLETDKGDFSEAIALGIVLLGISLSVNIALYFFSKRGRATGYLWV
ncbi:ABC transporter permease [Candidatus Magnetominusculus xianensis]|uniref:ABC transporter permease n=1 Tax=Candidatus Magnetominusculus xianensis TaxID=1748249 RepID=A0ABR5SIQ3_9BACT|nr:ABC transporter permease [Candidatus Magnetominusculus xianensis]KWT91097.1 ABC transporter permease [Candidatus Magnetominusculus xianensis]MBF0403258.1 ABC transporter permease [Nitrospirota bacterium]